MSRQAWTPRRAAADSRRHIRALQKIAEKRLQAIACLWSDENGYLETLPDSILGSLREQLDDLQAQIDDVVANWGQL